MTSKRYLILGGTGNALIEDNPKALEAQLGFDPEQTIVKRFEAKCWCEASAIFAEHNRWAPYDMYFCVTGERDCPHYGDMLKRQGHQEVEADALEQMKQRALEKGARWAAYENQALDSASCGALAFLCVGKGCTYTSAPEVYPGDIPVHWAYRHVGYVNLDTGMMINTVSRRT